jgi:hypothetical protein
MGPIVRRQQLDPASRDELCPLVNRGNADERVSLHRLMHHLLGDLGRLFDVIGCRESYNRRDRFRVVPATCSNRELYTLYVKDIYVLSSLHLLEPAQTTKFPPSCPHSHLRTRCQRFCNSSSRR